MSFSQMLQKHEKTYMDEASSKMEQFPLSDRAVLDQTPNTWQTPYLFNAILYRWKAQKVDSSIETSFSSFNGQLVVASKVNAYYRQFGHEMAKELEGGLNKIVLGDSPISLKRKYEWMADIHFHVYSLACIHEKFLLRKSENVYTKDFVLLIATDLSLSN